MEPFVKDYELMTEVPGQLYTRTVEGIVAAADAVFDYDEQKYQHNINADTSAAIATIDSSITDIYERIGGSDSSISDIYSKIDIIDSSISDIYRNIEITDSSFIQVFQNIDDIDSSISGIKSDVNLIDSSITSIKSDIETIDSSITDIYGDIDNIDSSISNIKSDIDAIDSSIVGIYEKIEQVDSSIVGIKSDIETIDSSISSIYGKIDDMDSSIAGIKSNIGTIDSSISNIYENIGNVDSSISDIKSDINTIDSSVSNIYGRLDTVDSSISSIIADNTVTDASVNSMEEYISTLTGKVDKLMGETTEITLTLLPDMVFYNEDTSVTITSNVSTQGDIAENSHAISKDGVVFISSSSDSIETQVNVDTTADKVYTSSVIVNGNEINTSATLMVTKHIYYGYGDNIENAVLSHNTSPKQNPQGEYRVNIEESGKYIFVSVPEDMNINGFTMNGFNMPFGEATVDPGREGYKYYMSRNSYDMGTIILVID